jgi:hypothetical protein
MSAITFKFGVQEDVNPTESAVASLSPEEAEAGGGLAGLGKTPEELGDSLEAEVTADAINVSHAGLEQMAWLRQAVSESLAGIPFHVEFAGREVKLVLDGSIPANMTPWNPPTSTAQRNFSLLSWTSKMGTPSFSLPAGPPVMGGSCPGAAAGMTIVPLVTLRARANDVAKVTGRPVRLAQAICQHCYAEGGQYATANVQVAQVLRYQWVQQALEDGSFVDVMSWALQNADYRLNGGTETVEELDPESGVTKKVKRQVRGERKNQKFFRLHDSGDFFSEQYIAAWRAVADNNPDVTIWAPTRAWAIPKLREAINTHNKGSQNLVIRPSAYHVNDPAFAVAELGPGFSAGTTVFKDMLKPSDTQGHVNVPDAPYDWDCQAYTTDSGKVTCRDALAPDGVAGCRACWLHGKGNDALRVNYTLH